MLRVVHKRTPNGPVEIKTDGRTVWVNGPSGAMLGRLGTIRIDVHGNGDEPCQDCRETPPAGAWDVFCASMLRHHGLQVPRSYRPFWCV